MIDFLFCDTFCEEDKRTLNLFPIYKVQYCRVSMFIIAVYIWTGAANIINSMFWVIANRMLSNPEAFAVLIGDNIWYAFDLDTHYSYKPITR